MDGIPVAGDSFTIDFGNSRKISALELHWKNLQPVQRLQAGTSAQIIDWIEAGKGVISSEDVPNPAFRQATNLTVSRATVCYMAEAGQSTNGFVYPVAQLEIRASLKDGQMETFRLDCPALSQNE